MTDTITDPAEIEYGPYRWKDLEWGDCPACSEAVEVYSDIESPPTWVNDSDSVRCTCCQWRGGVSLDDDEAWINDGNIEEICEKHGIASCTYHACAGVQP